MEFNDIATALLEVAAQHCLEVIGIVHQDFVRDFMVAVLTSRWEPRPSVVRKSYSHTMIAKSPAGSIS